MDDYVVRERVNVRFVIVDVLRAKVNHVIIISTLILVFCRREATVNNNSLITDEMKVVSCLARGQGLIAGHPERARNYDSNLS